MDVAAPGDRITLDKLQGEFRRVVSHPVPILWFQCPTCPSAHWHMIPFTRAEPHEDDRLGKVWKRTDGGRTVEGITLEPSYNCGCLHAYIRGGAIQVL
jgi:hypothetical protein